METQRFGQNLPKTLRENAAANSGGIFIFLVFR
jgi:hypothetical protein